MNPSGNDLLIWLGCLFCVVGGLNQGISLWRNLTGQMIQKNGPDADRLITSGELDKRLTGLNTKIDRVDLRLRKMTAPLSKLIGVIAAREKIDIELPTEEDAS